MDQFQVYIWLLSIIIVIGIVSKKLPIPTALLLVITGMLLSYIPHFPLVKLHEDVILNFFLPLLVYQSSATISWPDIKSNKRPIILLSVGHVVFITLLVAITAHNIIPNMSWPAAFVLGAIVSPPDDVAIFAVAEKVQFPQRILTVLAGESLLNDAAALIIFRFSLAALLTHQFSFGIAVSNFFAIIIFETLYGVILGNILGTLRLHVNDPIIQMLFSIFTPFIAYIPSVALGGCGVLATVVTGLVISHNYLERFTPETRLIWFSVWDTLSFTLSSMLFLLVGLHLRYTIQNINGIPTTQLLLYGIAITFVVIVGRFIWVYPSAYLPRFLFPSIRKNDPYPPWQLPFIVSWAGMRGGVSLAAALVIPPLMIRFDDTNLRDFLIFLVFCVIIATLLVQGLTLPWVIKKLGAEKFGKHERGKERLQEFRAKLAMAEEVSHWLTAYEIQVKEDPIFIEEIKIQMQEYQALRNRLVKIQATLQDNLESDLEVEPKSAILLFTQIISIERTVLAQLWRDGKINFKIKTKLQRQLDLREKRYSTS